MYRHKYRTKGRSPFLRRRRRRQRWRRRNGRYEVQLVIPMRPRATSTLETPRPRPGATKTNELAGGRGGIRTHGNIAATPDFESGAFDQLSHPSVDSKSGRGRYRKTFACRRFSSLWSHAKFRSGNDRGGGLIDLLFLGIAFGRPQVFVVIGEFVHGTPKQPDKARARRVEPLRRFVVQRRGAHGAG